MIPAGFDYHAPRSIADAIQLLAGLGPDAKLLAGGHSLLPMMKLRFAQPSHWSTWAGSPDLRGITQVGNEIHIGAMTTEHELLNRRCWPKRCRCWSRVPGGSPIRRCGTRAR
jgi:carbon-monoxide dehydrogenase medium subunit